MFIKGKRYDTRATVAVVNPYDQSIIQRVGLSDEHDVAEAVRTAQAGAEILRQMPAGERAKILERTAGLIHERREAFATIICQEVGKTINEARAEVRRGITTLSLSAAAALKLTGETVCFDTEGQSHKMGFYIRVPLGVVLAITPFNFPLNLSCHKIGPALAAGNAVIHKPATKTPLSAINLCQALIDAGLPAEGITVLVGPGSTIGAKLVQNPDIRKISFTGSLEVGNEIMKQCGMKRVTMELGSNSAVVVFKDAPLDLVAQKIRKGGYTLAGQVCISVQRVYVEEDCADEFLRALSLEVAKIKWGDPMAEDTDMGPLIDEAALAKAQRFCEDALQHKGILILGGRRDGPFFLPTIIFKVSEDAAVIQEEAFAPLVVVNTFKTIDEAIAKVNNTKYGLQVGIFTQNITTALACAQHIHAGGVLINEIPTFRVDNMPYGGTKGSGIGREGPDFAIKEMTEEKLIVFDELP